MTLAVAKTCGPGRPKDLEKRAAILAAAKRLFPLSGFETPASAAIASMLVPSKPDSGKSRFAAARIAARFSRSLGRPGPQVFATANVIGALLALDAASGFIYYTDRYMNSVSAPRA